MFKPLGAKQSSRYCQKLSRILVPPVSLSIILTLISFRNPWWPPSVRNEHSWWPPSVRNETLLLNVFYNHHSGVQSFFQPKTEHISLRIGLLLRKICSSLHQKKAGISLHQRARNRRAGKVLLRNSKKLN